MTELKTIEYIDDAEMKGMLEAFKEIQMPRTPFELERFVVGPRFTEEQRYAQCVLEMSIAYYNLQSAKLNVEKKDIEIEEIKTPGRKGEIEKELLRLEQEQTKLAMLGAFREFSVLYNLWQKFPKKYTRQDLDNASERDFKIRLETQAKQDLIANGRISVSNQEGLRQIGVEVTESSLLPIIDPVEQRYLEQGKSRMLIGVPTEIKAENGLKCLENIVYPSGVEIKIFNNYGNKIDDAYTFIARQALLDNADYLVTIEDDTFPPNDAIIKLFDLLKSETNKGNKVAVGAWYPKREEPAQGVHIIVGKNERGPLKADNNIHEVYTLAMGCSIYPVKMFKEIPEPWFKTTNQLSQDSYFSQKARDAGYKLLVDTSIRCKHIDRITNKVYE